VNISFNLEVFILISLR